MINNVSISLVISDMELQIYKFLNVCPFVSICLVISDMELQIYKFLNMCPFDYTAFAVSGKVGYP